MSRLLVTGKNVYNQFYRLNQLNYFKFSSKTNTNTNIRTNFNSSEKISTGITGLSADPSARANLLRLCNEIKAELGGLPDDYSYKSGLLALTSKRISIIANQEHSDVDVECIIDSGQLEELVEQAQEELVLINKIKNEWKPWERTDGNL